MHVRLALVVAVAFTCLTLPVEAARWRMGPENLVEPREYGESGTVTIGDGKDTTWFWSTGWGITFRPDANMADDQSSDVLSVGKTAGGTCYWTMTFRFAKPVSRFRFTTPRCSSLELSEGDLVLYGTVDDGERRELWRYGKDSPGYRPGSDATIEPAALDWIEPAEPATTVTLYFEYVGFVGDVSFHADSDDGGVLEYVAALLPPEQMVSLTLVPDAKKISNVYRTDQPVRVLLDIGPTPVSSPPELVLFDLMREGQTAAGTFEPIGRDDWQIDLPEAQAGVYQLRVVLPIGGEGKTVEKDRIVLVHPPRKLSRAQELRSPFGIIGIDGEGAWQGSAYVSGQDLARLIGVHQLRGGTMTWCVGNPAKDVYNLGGDPREMVEHDMQYGLVRRHSLAFSPGWTVDPNRATEGWAGVWPPKPEHLADYAEYCRRLATMTKGYYVPEFEIWNEPNSEPYGSFKGTFDEFVAICRTAADAILAVNPEARMILGSTGGADVGYIVRLLEAGLSEKYRLVDIHPYRSTKQGPEDGLLVDIRRLRKAIADHGDGQGIIFSEIGWPTHIGDKPSYEAVTQFQQACFFSRTMLISIAAGVERFHFHMLRDWGGNLEEPEHNFGIITCAGEAKLAVPAMATTSRHLEDAAFLGRVGEAPEFHHVWYWRTPWMEGAVLAAIWCDTVMVEGEPQWIDLPAEPLAAEDLWGGRPGEERLRQADGRWQVRPDEDPVFVYLPESALPKGLAELPTAMRPWHLRRLEAMNVEGRAIVVDGELAEWPELPAGISLDAAASGGTMGYAGVEEPQEGKDAAKSVARFGVAYNGDGLYVAADVIDPDGMHNDRSHWWVWAGDCVRVYLSTVDSEEFPYFTDDHFQAIFAPVTKDNGPPQAVHISARTPRGVESGDLIPDALVAAKPTETGWALEGFLPWSYFGKTPQAGQVWGFDLQAAGRSWNGGADNWCTPLRWGKLVFVE
ncbi:MAG: hypothetical protein GXY33_16200 [Phycisphaerae bacterium]|nr:hypothetical protein [Phycisphaerae bacterium]